LVGSVPCRRAYYYCHRCGTGSFPRDEAVGLTPQGLTPAAAQVVSMAGAACNRFAEAAEHVSVTRAGLQLSESTGQRTTEEAGQRLGALLAAGKALAFPQPWDWHRDAEGCTCAYGSLDATGGRQQAEDGGPAEGRMPYVAMAYNPVPERTSSARISRATWCSSWVSGMPRSTCGRSPSRSVRRPRPRGKGCASGGAAS
jgi:hypothetical protein